MNDDYLETLGADSSAKRERNYLLKRADDHRRLALKAIEPIICATHGRMQQLYEERADHVNMMHMD